jgi:hypothetical protein
MNHKAMLVLTAGFFIWGSDKEYGDLNDALMRTMAQDLPPYHQTANTAQVRADSGVTATPPALPNPPASSEQTPNLP